MEELVILVRRRVLVEATDLIESSRLFCVSKVKEIRINPGSTDRYGLNEQATGQTLQPLTLINCDAEDIRFIADLLSD
jgi:hypothetical protein